MVYGELGRFPLDINIKLRMVSFYSRMMKNENKLSSIMFKLLLNLHQNGTCYSKWIAYVKSIFDECGLSYVFMNQQYIDISLYKPIIKQTLRDQFIQKWFQSLAESSRGSFYSIFKTNFCIENYLLKLSGQAKHLITKFRCCNINIPIEKGRWHNIPKEERLCVLCTENTVGDEFHYLFLCKNAKVVEFRNKFIPSYYIKNPSTN